MERNAITAAYPSKGTGRRCVPPASVAVRCSWRRHTRMHQRSNAAQQGVAGKRQATAENASIAGERHNGAGRRRAFQI